MLISHPDIVKESIFTRAFRPGLPPQEIVTGIYEIDHFGGTHYPVGKKRDFYGDYGVCDNWEQVVAAHPYVNKPDRRFIITLTKVAKTDELSKGRWCWKFWGKYIGNLKPKHEYLHEEDDSIQQVFCYHIYEIA